MRLPENFEKKMRDLLKEDFDDYIACYEEPLRLNIHIILQGFIICRSQVP